MARALGWLAWVVIAAVAVCLFAACDQHTSPAGGTSSSAAPVASTASPPPSEAAASAARNSDVGLPAPSGVAAPRPSPLIQNVSGRRTQTLNGTWHAIIDPYENGYYDYRLQPQTADGYFANRKPSSKSDRVEYDFDASGTLDVPGDWNSQRPELFFYEGTVWYKKDFEPRRDKGRRLFLHFGAANYDAKVYVNGTKAGAHIGGFTPFDVEITGAVRAKDNFVVVKVDNQRHRDGVPTVSTDWWNYGGLTRDVLLVDVPETFLRDYALYAADDPAAGPPGPHPPRRIAGWVQLDGPRAEQDVVVRVGGLGDAIRVRTDARGYARFEAEVAIDPWSPDHPRLYDVDIEAETDRVADRVGFRTVRTAGADILLNGKPIFLRGISIHEQAPMREGRAFSLEDARTLLGWARELGANFVRLAHYPHSESMARLADEMGLMVWEEIPVYWTIEWENPATLANAASQLSEMIDRDKNRAAVVIWSVGNETPESAPRLRFLGSLVDLARKLDGSRLVSAALEPRRAGAQERVLDDSLGGLLDVLGCNEYIGWYDGLPPSADAVRWTSAFDKPLVVTEFGADALQGLHGDALTRWTEEYQASVYEHQLRMLARIPSLRGMTPWILADFRSPRRPLPGILDYWNRKGLVSDRGQKKQAFYVLAQYYRRMAEASGR
jgi:beta-glucuronidase